MLQIDLQFDLEEVFLKSEKGRDTQSFSLDDEEYAKSQKGPYANGLRVYGPVDDFDVCGCLSGNLVSHCGAFGVRFEKTAEGGAKK